MSTAAGTDQQPGPVPSAEPPAADWAALGRGLARQHRRQAPRFGYDTDNYLGQKPQRNPWTDDGHDFFATHRLLRYLTEPRSEQVLTAADRAAVGRIANRLPTWCRRRRRACRCSTCVSCCAWWRTSATSVARSGGSGRS